MQFLRSGGAAGIPGILAILWLMAGCAGTPARDAGDTHAAEAGSSAVAPQPAARAAGGLIADVALAMVGVPYRYGGAHPSEGFDCSGLVYYTYTSNGHAVPRTSREQFDVAQKIVLADATEGDLVFFRDESRLSHVGIYLGSGRFVHAPSSGGSVQVADVFAPYYRRHLVAVGRLLP